MLCARSTKRTACGGVLFQTRTVAGGGGGERAEKAADGVAGVDLADPKGETGKTSRGDGERAGSSSLQGCLGATVPRSAKRSGYMAMLAVDTTYRRSGIGTALVKRAVRRMRRHGCSSVSLETEVTNKAAMRLYEDRLGFIREELLVRYYLNWGDAYRLRLWFD